MLQTLTKTGLGRFLKGDNMKKTKRILILILITLMIAQTSSTLIQASSVADSEAIPTIMPELTQKVTTEETPMFSPKSVSGANLEDTPEVSPEVTPEITPEVTPEITPEITPEPSKNGWVKEDGMWKYYLTNDEYLQDTWEKINNKWYYFFEDGTMATGWQKINSKWYYLKGGDDGSMVTGWLKLNDRWYYLKEGDDGSMVTGWFKLNDRWYYLNEGDDGSMVTGWLKLNDRWYYLKGGDDGSMVTGWLKLNDKWYYLKSGDDGRLLTGWFQVNNKWYYANGGDDGSMVTGWLRWNNNWYYLKLGNDGSMVAGNWVKSNGKEFYLETSGKMAINKWIGQWYVGGDGAWIPNDRLSLAKRLENTKTAQKTNQIITVAGGRLTLWEKQGTAWKQILSDSCTVGRNGISENRTQGDMTTPAGAFTMTLSFGLNNNPGTQLPYRKITQNSYWIGNINDNDYNTWQERTSGHKDDEHLIEYSVYKYAIAIDFNTEQIKGKGSAIFLHITGGPATAGCVGVRESTMLELMKRTKKGSYIIIAKSEADIAKY